MPQDKQNCRQPAIKIKYCWSDDMGILRAIGKNKMIMTLWMRGIHHKLALHKETDDLQHSVDFGFFLTQNLPVYI